MNYLITGGLGVIGSLISKRLIRDGHSVTIIDDGQDARHDFNAPDCPTYGNRIEETAPSLLAEIVASSDRILHAAASTGIPYSAEQPLDDWRRNVDGTLALLEALRKSPRPTVILSSVKPYALGRLSSLERPSRFEPYGGVDESFPLLPEEPYGASKAAQSLIAHSYAVSYGLPLNVFRCSNLYGPAACHGARHGWLTWFCIRVALGLPIEIQGKGNQTRDMLFWSDVLSAAEAAWGRLGTGPIATFTDYPGRGAIFNLGGGKRNTVSPLEAVATLRSLGATVETTLGPGRRHEDPIFVTDTAAVEQALRWKSAVNVEDGIAQIYEWACENRSALAGVYGSEAR